MSLASRIPIFGILAGIALLIIGFVNDHTALVIVGFVLIIFGLLRQFRGS